MPRTYHIPAQSLNDALVKFAAQSNLELIFSAELVRGLQSQTIDTTATPEQALTLLLKGNGISHRFIDERTVTLQANDLAETQDRQPRSVLEPLTVTGLRPKSRAGVTPEAGEDFSEQYRYQIKNVASATRTDTPIKEIPQSIQTVNRQLLNDQHTLFLSDALSNVSGVVARSQWFSPVIEGTLIRGFRAEQLIDGFTQYYNTGDRESTVNVERVEVLKGANAIFYSGGSGSPVGGVINVVSKLPQPRASREIGFTAGSYDYYQPYVDINQPLNANALFRITAEHTDSASHIDNIETERFNINPALTFTDNDATTLTLQGKISHWTQPEYQGLPATGTLAGHFKIPRETFIGPPNIPDSVSTSHAVWAKLEHQLNRIWALDLRAHYSNSRFDEKVQTLFNGSSFVADTPLSPPSTWALANGELYQQQQELSFVANAIARFDAGAFENTLLVGGDHSKLNDDGFVEAAGPVAFVDMATPSFTVAYRDPGTRSLNQFVSNTLYGGYLQWQSNIAKRLHTLLSLRFGVLEIDYAELASHHVSRTQTEKLLPRVGAVYDLSDQISVFAGYSEGMRGQPFVRFDDTPAPELSQQIESGFKFDFSGQLSGQIAVYQIDREHVGVPNVNSPSAALFSAAGHQRSMGIETDLAWQPTAAINILASFAHCNARFVGDAGGIADGNRVAWVPEDSGRLWTHYRFQEPLLAGVSIGFGVNLRSASYIGHDNAFKVGDYHSFDAAIAYETQALRLAVTAKNISDNDYFQPFQYYGGGYIGGGRVVPSAGASVFFSAMLRF